MTRQQEYSDMPPFRDLSRLAVVEVVVTVLGRVHTATAVDRVTRRRTPSRGPGGNRNSWMWAARTGHRA